MISKKEIQFTYFPFDESSNDILDQQINNHPLSGQGIEFYVLFDGVFFDLSYRFTHQEIADEIEDPINSKYRYLSYEFGLVIETITDSFNEIFEDIHNLIFWSAILLENDRDKKFNIICINAPNNQKKFIELENKVSKAQAKTFEDYMDQNLKPKFEIMKAIKKDMDKYLEQ